METTFPSQAPVGRVHCLPSGDFYVQACHSDVHLCPKARVSPGLDAAAAEHRTENALSCASEEESVGPSSVCESSTLLDAVEAMESDDEEESVVSSSSQLDVATALDSDDEEPTNGTVVRRRARVVLSVAALDLCPTVGLTSLSDTYSSSCSEDEPDDDEDTEDDETEDESDQELVGRKRKAKRTSRLWSWECDNVPLDQIDSMIRSNMVEIEAKKPWRFVFRCLAVPFNFKREEDPFDVFFMRWDGFWRVHGRAVWERAFWQPLLAGSTEYYRRKARQARAQQAFRDLATDLAERLGRSYRRGLAKALHEGWWYRTEPFALRRLFLKDRRLYEEYLVRRVKERWPRGRKFLLERGLKPMWWLVDSN